MRFSGLYYAQVLKDLRRWTRINVPEINDEDPHEPFSQLLALIAYVFHQQSVLLDHSALESLFGTCRTREAIANHLALIGVKLRQDVPATADQICKLSSVLTSDKTFLGAARFETEATADTPALTFETAPENVTLSRGDRLTSCKAIIDGVWEDFTDVANGDDPVAFDPWATAGSLSVGDTLYFGHQTVLPTSIRLTFPAGEGTWLASRVVWEYYDGQIDVVSPSAVTDQTGGVARLVLTSLLGSTYDRTGTEVWITSTRTGGRKMVESEYGGGVNYVDVLVSDLGLAAVSTVTSDYLVGSYWREVPDFEAIGYSTTTTVKGANFSLPETLERRWQKSILADAVDGAPDTEACYWLRLRSLNSSALTFDLQSVAIDTTAQYLKFAVTQGATQTESLGTATSAPNQTFSTTLDAIVNASLSIEVDEGGGYQEWTLVDDFLASQSTSRHVFARFDETGTAIVSFGDGIQGRIPTEGSDIKASYRTGARRDGNVAANSITVNRSGTGLFSSAYNPRPASGWQIAEGSSYDDIERLKIAGPATLRTSSKVVTPSDIETVATSWVSDSGASPFVRAYAREAAYGPKTVEVVVVDVGGQIPSTLLDEFELYLNGEAATDQKGVILFNTTATVVRYTPEPIDVVVTTIGGDAGEIEAILRAFLSPTATEEDGSYVHQFESDIYLSRVSAEIFKVSGVKHVSSLTLDGVAGSYTLGVKGLPNPGTITVTVT